MSKTVPEQDEPQTKLVCGLIMPISTIDGCDESHWKDVLGILSKSIADAGYEPNLVSNDTDVGVIHKRIVHNIYSNPVAVCDVSGKNPNVMFELGMRLAFDKPVIIVKDDKTSYSFDTSPVEHLTYPRDLRFGSIIEFQSRLTEKIRKSQRNTNTFLSSFGTFKVAEISQEKVGPLDIVLEELSSLKISMRRMEDRAVRDGLSRTERARAGHSVGSFGLPKVDFTISGEHDNREKFYRQLTENRNVINLTRAPVTGDTDRYLVFLSPEKVSPEMAAQIKALAEKYSTIIDNFSWSLP